MIAQKPDSKKKKNLMIILASKFEKGKTKYVFSYVGFLDTCSGFSSSKTANNCDMQWVLAPLHVTKLQACNCNIAGFGVL